MLNNVSLVGRLTKDVELRETDNGLKVSNITVAIPRPYKNSNGEQETDFVDVTMWRGIAENTAEYCKKGDIIAIKGRFETNIREDKDGNNVKVQNIEEQLKNEVLSNENISWLENFIRNEKITKLTKKIVDEFINEIIIYNKNTIKVTFKYENEYILALDYLNKTKYDII